MDPFNEVQDDAWTQINALEQALSRVDTVTPDARLDFNNDLQELEETINDLNEALRVSEATPQQFSLTPQDIASRHLVVKQLETKRNEIRSLWNAKGSPNKQRPVTSMSNRISQDETDPFDDAHRIDNEFAQYQQQEVIRDQDIQLDAIHQTMHNLNQQAMIMGSELEEQGYMLDELDQDLDNVDRKMAQGMRRINIFIERNKERASDWCIGILVVALCVLLLVIILA